MTCGLVCRSILYPKVDLFPYLKRSALPEALMAMIVYAESALGLALKHQRTHLIFEIFADGDTVTQTLPTPRLEYQIPSQRLARSGLKRSELNTRIGRITRYGTPVIETHLTECLT